ncbi:MAG: Glu-tRNA(Gln) amidotransferase subunit GatE [Candidatus Lokiarchaeota archaeon]|nr:Glu-tRNA(Gln) amidotransferase subunit GatE [Candidatus Lokiarchaeota archaeon]
MYYLSKWDYEKLGLKAGIEIHQELNTNSKLFCRCEPELTTEDPDFILQRNFRPVLGEMGEFDKAMLVEYQKGLMIQYEGYDDYSCSYEIDETPPFEIDWESLRIGVILCLLFNMKPIQELHVCRKNYLDGSVPCGFQRTTIFGLNGYIEINDKKYGVNTLCIEEDAARKVDYDEKNKIITYRLDRLGIPLVEIVTDPDIKSPQEFEEIAFNLGLLLRSSGLVKRGIGTIRQDINVSIKEGARVEIKGVQKLEWIKGLIDNEIERQKNLIKITKEMKKRGLSKSDFDVEYINLSKTLKNTHFKPLKSALKKNQKVFGIKAPKMQDLLGSEIQNNKSFGKEIAEKLRSITGLKGLIHSDENLKKYKIHENEIQAINKQLSIEDNDAFIFVFGPENKAIKSLDVIIRRLKMALDGVPTETRKARETLDTEFIRELHGGKRLYPDTDMHPIFIRDELIDELKSDIPEYPWEIISRIKNTYDIDENYIIDLILDKNLHLFERIMSKLDVDPKLVCVTLLQTLKALGRKNIPIENISDENLLSIFKALDSKKIAKEAIDDILPLMATKPNLSLEDILKDLDIKRISKDSVDNIIDEIIEKNKDFIVENGERSFNALMGDVMKNVRGKMDGKMVSKILKNKIKKFLKKVK